jgi:L-ascorbate metabolism protein UlaG (beta-lactamase superfamily)
MTGFIYVVVIVLCISITSRGTSDMKSVSYKSGKFVNSVPVKEFSLKESIVIGWIFLFGSKEGRVPKQTLPVIKPEPFQEPPYSAIKYNWLGHSSILLEIEDKRILLDPVFSERISFTQLFGPKRFHPTPLSLEELPQIDMVLISHNHYDHLDKKVVNHFKNSAVDFFVPLGIKSLLIKWGVRSEKVYELNWWEEIELDGLTVVSTPARHFSNRGAFDVDKTLWTSWSIIGKKHKAYFSGDTGITPQFSEIGEKFGPFDLTFIKIGAYGEMWPDVHLNPEEAVQAHIMLRGRQLVPIHWGTFDVAFHSWQEPIERIIVAAEKDKVSLLTSMIGETVIPFEHENSYWWRGLY